MNFRRGFRRAAVFLTVIYWAVVAHFMVNNDYGYGWEYGYGYETFDEGAFLGMAAMIYALAFGVAWTLYGFFSDSRSG